MVFQPTPVFVFFVILIAPNAMIFQAIAWPAQLLAGTSRTSLPIISHAWTLVHKDTLPTKQVKLAMFATWTVQAASTMLTTAQRVLLGSIGTNFSAITHALTKVSYNPISLIALHAINIVKRASGLPLCALFARLSSLTLLTCIILQTALDLALEHALKGSTLTP